MRAEWAALAFGGFEFLEMTRKVTWYPTYVTFQLAEIAVPRQLFAAILERIGRLANQPAVCPSG